MQNNSIERNMDRQVNCNFIKQPTMSDVAKLAGVSQPTVSHVINGTASISIEVKGRVNEAIRKIGYAPHINAKKLRVGKPI